MGRPALTTQDFISKARAVHGNKYDYSLAFYKTNRNKLVIICPVHGTFEQSPVNHIFNKHHCPACSLSTIGKLRKRNTEWFIKQAMRVHGNEYDYSQVNYTHSQNRVKIICPKHGVFEQIPTTHLKGCGCFDCKPDKIADTTESFVLKAKARHGDKYSYSKVVYKRTLGRVVITCLLHGDFKQVAASHLNGRGCKKCAERANASWVERATGGVGTLYFIRFFDSTEEFYKIGITSNSIEKRFDNKSVYGNYYHEVLAVYKSSNVAAVFEWEQSILESFAYLTYRPKRHFPGATECFSSADEILAIFPL